MNTTQNVIHSGTMNGASIDAMSEAVARALTSEKLSEKDILRLRLAVESVMGVWAEELGEDVSCRLLQKKRFGKTGLLLQCGGKSVDPTLVQDELLLSVSSNPNMVAALGLPAEYRYAGGQNELRLHLPRKKANPLRNVLIAMAAAILLGVGLRRFAPEFAVRLASELLSPLVNTVTRALSLIAGPLVFLSIVSGINGVGDTSAFGRIGGTLLKRFFAMTFVISVLIWVSVSWLFPVTLSGGAEGESAFTKLLEMLLNIVPGDIVSPFQTGNAMQIIFIAVCVGIGTILLGDTLIDTVQIVNQVNALVQLLMAGISRLLPGFIFLSISNLIISSDLAELSGIMVPLLLIVGLSLLLSILYGFYAALKTGTAPGKLFRSQLPSFLVAFATDSSAAAFSANVECCEKKLHIDQKLVRFGIPLGQVLFMPAAAIIYIILALYMAKQYTVPITPTWLLTLLIMATILAAATPPIPGGALSSALVLFMQLGIPSSCIALSSIVLLFSDYVGTACNIACLQQELFISAKKLGLIKEEK